MGNVFICITFKLFYSSITLIFISLYILLYSFNALSFIIILVKCVFQNEVFVPTLSTSEPVSSDEAHSSSFMYCYFIKRTCFVSLSNTDGLFV